jgi:predicted phage terminase large subunit-like protein
MNMPMEMILQKSKIPENRDKLLAELCRKDMRRFIEVFWKVVEPGIFKGGWHIDCICDHLEACAKGEIRKLIINMPPRHMKSLNLSVFFQPWVWLSDPGKRFLYASYSDALATRDCVNSRYIVKNPKYINMIRRKQESRNPEWTLRRDQDQKTRYSNTEKGHRITTSVGGKGTGEGGDFVIIDDPNNTKESESLTQLEATNTWYDLVIPSRVNDPDTGVFIICQQRVHEKDLTGHILKKELKNWETLILPARYEKKNRIITCLGWVDQRKEKGEPLWPVHYGDKALKELEENFASPYIIAGQLQQRPAPKEGGMFKRDDFRIMKASVFEEIKMNKQIKSTVRYWDKAGTEDGGCNTAGVRMHVTTDKPPKLIISNVTKGQWAYAKREARIKMKAEDDKAEFKRYTVWVEQEPGSAGKESADRTIKNLIGIACKADKVSGNKVVRAQPYEAQVDANNVYLVSDPDGEDWIEDFLDEHQLFPRGEFKDQVDASAGAMSKLINRKNRAGVA